MNENNKNRKKKKEKQPETLTTIFNTQGGRLDPNASMFGPRCLPVRPSLKILCCGPILCFLDGIVWALHLFTMNIFIRERVFLSIFLNKQNCYIHSETTIYKYELK